MRKSWLILIVSVLALSCASTSSSADEPNELYYAIEQNGTVCGYAHVLFADKTVNGKPATELTDSLWLQLSLMGKTIMGHYLFTYLIDPETGMYFHHTSKIDQETVHLGAEMWVVGDSMNIYSPPDPETTVVALAPGTVLQNTRVFPHLVRWFADDTLTAKTCTVFNEADGKSNEIAYTKLGSEELKLAGKDYDALKVRVLNRTTGVEYTLWIEKGFGLALKMEHPIRSWYLTDSNVRKQMQVAEFDRNIFASVGELISNPWALSYMKVRGKLQPAGMWLTPASLNVGGQSFQGTVEDNKVDGVFEIRYDRYDGSNSPSFPCDFSEDDSLQRYLKPSQFIESDEPVLIEAAKRITDGATDAWDAATQLSHWVNEEIGYDVPGGGTALNTYKLRLGECGSHANLLAAFCRAVGIPARCVFGCMYVPEHGGSFGQHAWNEIYMGAAGWIPVDCTADEVTYADCGHIRLGEWVSMTSLLNPDTMEILDYSVGEGTYADLVKVTDVDYDGLLGKYQGPDKVMTILTQDGKLALDIPGRMVFQLKDPDESGEWYFVLTDRASVSFATDGDGNASSLTINSRQRLPRAADTTTIVFRDTPEEYRPFIGKYVFPMQNTGATVSYRDDHLQLSFSPEYTLPMEKQEETDGFLAKTPKSTLAISFEQDDAGKVSALKFSELVTCPKISSD
jgi:transglutaminase-like putative cysteine protease